MEKSIYDKRAPSYKIVPPPHQKKMCTQRVCYVIYKRVRRHPRADECVRAPSPGEPGGRDLGSHGSRSRFAGTERSFRNSYEVHVVVVLRSLLGRIGRVHRTKWRRRPACAGRFYHVSRFRTVGMYRKTVPGFYFRTLRIRPPTGYHNNNNNNFYSILRREHRTADREPFVEFSTITIIKTVVLGANRLFCFFACRRQHEHSGVPGGISRAGRDRTRKFPGGS